MQATATTRRTGIRQRLTAAVLGIAMLAAGPVLVSLLGSPAAEAGQLAVNAPGWCRAPGNATERMICADYRLSSLDAQMNNEFQMAVSNITSAANGGTKADVTRFRNQQQAWLYQRNSCGGYLPCIQSTYQARLKVLRAMNQPE